MKKLINALALALMTGPIAQATDAEVTASRQASARFADINVAKAEGYTQLFECTVNPKAPSKGTMGVHFINGDFASDGELDISKPEVLMYEPQPDGSMQLVALEYVVFENKWNGAETPTFMGQEMKRKTAVGTHPVDPFYEVHVWHWRHNPDGIFADWNRQVSCAHDTTAQQ
ncbi:MULTISPECIES: hypothetical protein [Kordiimonas]|uniref:hypothetical protein n=1 Tax=Kordiimonas TaxID=288021 RepID=UPI00257F2086|nr:hypothetical protein [Kordiimonas sp. UBA4487]